MSNSYSTQTWKYYMSDEISTPLSTIIEVTDNVDELSQGLTQRQQPPRTILMNDISRRLSQRKQLYKRLYISSNIMCILALFGIINMIIENELSFRNRNHKQTKLSFFIKLSISITTIILISYVIYYNYIKLKLYAVNNSLDDYYTGLTKENILIILLELFICSIHPFPRYLPMTNTFTLSHIDSDVLLSLPMFLRIYLLCRCILYHSHLVHDTCSQSLGYLNRVTINFMFLLKTYLQQWPITCLSIFSISFFLIGSWSLRACNYDVSVRHTLMLDSMWLFIVTFTTVGYGDLSPSTYCGRTIAAMIGLIGILSTALLISVVTRKLELTRAENYVHHFVSNLELSKERKHHAANIIKFAWRIWFLKRKNRSRSMEYVKLQRKLTQSIHQNHQLRCEQKHLFENCNGLPEMMTTQRETDTKIEENIQRSTNIQQKVDQIEGTVAEMNQMMIKIENKLDLLVNKISQ